jgi:hypothetical protein
MWSAADKNWHLPKHANETPSTVNDVLKPFFEQWIEDVNS